VREFVLINRNMIQLKSYFDLEINCDEFDISWSQTYDPAFSQVATAIDLILPTTIDPSPLLSWWDKIRVVMHGGLKINSQKTRFNSTVNLIDPHDIDERLVFEFRDFSLQWKNSKFIILCDLFVNIKTIKSEPSQLAHMPNLKLVWKSEYELTDPPGNPNDHHSVTPVNPDTIGDGLNWDTYEHFRSNLINVDLSLHVPPPGSENTARINLYESNIELIRQWINSLAFPIRPTRRTIYDQRLCRRKFFFANSCAVRKSMKPKLGRSFNFGKFTFSRSSYC